MRLSVAAAALLRRQRPSELLIRRWHLSCGFHTTARVLVVKPFILADIGEGIRECEVIQWFVGPEARVEEFDKICELQSDKASVEIPSRFSGVIKKLYYEPGEMAIVGKPLIDIDVSEEAAEAMPEPEREVPEVQRDTADHEDISQTTLATGKEADAAENSLDRPKHGTLATPATRHLSKELGVDINDVSGTGRDGRVSKDDIQKFAAARSSTASPSTSTPTDSDSSTPAEYLQQLTPTQHHMFKTMTKSLTIPHFLYADDIDFTSLYAIRRSINTSLAKSSPGDSAPFKISFLPFVIKALSLALHRYPILNAAVDTSTTKPALRVRAQHNIGVAMDTPSGLVVPVVRDVAALSVLAIAHELQRLRALATAGKLSRAELQGGTFTLSNIGSIGGTVVSPVVVDGQVAILGMGKVRGVPAFGADGAVVRREVVGFSWSADHRVVDGATVARAGELVREALEDPGMMILQLR